MCLLVSMCVGLFSPAFCASLCGCSGMCVGGRGGEEWRVCVCVCVCVFDVCVRITLILLL